MATQSPRQLRIDATFNDFQTWALVDTGAAFCCLPERLLNQVGGILEPTNVVLSSCTGESINVLGELAVTVGLRSLRRNFEWKFVVAEVSTPILGLDFLTHFRMILNCAEQTIMDQETSLNSQLGVAAQPDCQHLKFDIPIPENVRPIFEEYEKVVRSKMPHDSNAEVKKPIQMKHYIETNPSSPPPVSKVRRLHGTKWDCAKAEIDKLLKAGIIRVSNSPYASPIHMAPKGSTYRMTGDYRLLNGITVPDRYPLPHLFSFNEKLEGCTVFSKIDVVSAYHHVPVNEPDIPKTAIITPFGLYEYVYMPFGLRNAASTYQRLMDQIMVPCTDFSFWLVDDILIASKNREEHRKQLMEAIKILDENNLTISLSKSVFEVPELDFVGHHVSAEGIRPTQAKIEAVQSFEQPEDYAGLRRYLGMLGFYRRMIPHFAERTYLLSEMLRLQPNAKQLEWSQEAITQFQESRELLSNAVCLPHPSAAENPYHLVVDASSVGIGGALHEVVDGIPRPIGFFSKKLNDAQKKYSTYDRELLAAYESVLHFRDFIEGHSVTLFSDHKPLVSAFHSSKPGKTDRQERYWTVICEYVERIEYIRGEENIVADCMSRSIASVHVDLFDLTSLAVEQEKDSEIDEYRDRLKSFELPSKKSILCDTSTPVPRPFVPKNCRERVFQELHNVAHPGVKSSVRLVKLRYFWPNIDADVKNFTRGCLSCQQSKINRHTKSPVMDFALPTSARFQYVHLDLVGPLPAVSEPGVGGGTYRYLLTMIDRATRWVECVPLVDITAQSVAFAFLNGWVSRFGVPLYICTDQGRQFEAELFQCLSKMLGFTRLRTSSYHPQGNGFLERLHRSLKSILKARKENWLMSLPFALLGLRAHPNVDNGCSPFALVTGTNVLVPPVAIVSDELEDPIGYVGELAKTMSSIDFHALSGGSNHAVPRPYVPKELDSCSHVWLRIDRVLRPLEAPYEGPFEVLERHEKTFLLRKPEGKTVLVSIDRVKPVQTSVPTRPSKKDDVQKENATDAVRSEDQVSDVVRDRVLPDGGRDVGRDVQIDEDRSVQADVDRDVDVTQGLDRDVVVAHDLGRDVEANVAQDDVDVDGADVDDELENVVDAPTLPDRVSRSGRRIAFKAKPDYFYF